MFKAKLDINGVYFGMEEVAELLDGDIEVPEDCDLPPGKYKWDGNTFIALPAAQHTTTPNAPLGERALYELIKAIPAAPDYCKAWATWYETTLDFKGDAK